MKLVNENIKHFERGLEPRTAMGTGISVTIKELLLEIFDYVSVYLTVTNVTINRWEVLVDIIMFKGKPPAINNLNKKIIKLGLNHFLKIPEHSIDSRDYGYATILYKFKPEFVGLFSKEDTLIESMQFQRGLEPKAAMGTGLESQIKQYAETIEDGGTSNEDILNHIINYDLGSNSSLTEETSKLYIDWLLKHIDLKYIDADIIEGLSALEWNLVPYYKKHPDSNFVFKKNATGYILETNEWDNFAEYFQKGDRNSGYEKYIAAVLSGDSMEYFQYDLIREYNNNLDVYDLQQGNPSEFGDIMEVIMKLKFPDKEKKIEIMQRAKFASVMFDFIWKMAETHAGFKKLKYQISRAASETVEAGNEHEAFKDIVKQLEEHFDMDHAKVLEELGFNISEKGLNKHIYAYYLSESRVKFFERDLYGDFDINVFHDCFDNAIND